MHSFSLATEDVWYEWEWIASFSFISSDEDIFDRLIISFCKGIFTLIHTFLYICQHEYSLSVESLSLCGKCPPKRIARSIKLIAVGFNFVNDYFYFCLFYIRFLNAIFNFDVICFHFNALISLRYIFWETRQACGFRHC